jgi:hypothetical protein
MALSVGTAMKTRGADGRRDQADFDERVAMAFLDDRGGGVAGAGAETDDGVDQEAADEHEQDDDQPDRVHENIILHLRHRTLRIEGRLANRQVGLRAAGGDQGESGAANRPSRLRRRENIRRDFRTGNFVKRLSFASP